VVRRDDYVKLLHIFAASHRKNGRPYIAEACNPDTGSWEGHDSYNHSEHYFHSSFNDLVITGLIGLKPRGDDIVEIDPLAPPTWNYFALDDVPYHGRKLSIVWDRDGRHYGGGAGLRVWVDGKVITSADVLRKVAATLPPKQDGDVPVRPRMNFAVNNDGDYFPRLTASFSNPKMPLYKVNDGNYWYTVHPPNRWTTEGSTNVGYWLGPYSSTNGNDWLEIDFGVPRRIDTVKLYFLDDGTSVLAPAGYEVQKFEGGSWHAIEGRERGQRDSVHPEGHRANIFSFTPLSTTKLRVAFNHARDGRTGFSEIEAWGDTPSNYTPAPPPAGNLAIGARAAASFWDRFGGVPQLAIDGKVNYRATPVNRWTSYGSTNKTDWLEITFDAPKEISRAELYIYDDHGGVQAPASYTVEYWAEGKWHEADSQEKTPEVPAGNMANEVRFTPVTTQKLRIIFTHRRNARSGVTEIEFWRN
jgi:hypothetical protein